MRMRAVRPIAGSDDGAFGNEGRCRMVQCDGGQMMTKARPITLSSSMNPRSVRESAEWVRLSPITNSLPPGTRRATKPDGSGGSAR